MYKNYFILNRFVSENNDALKGGIIKEIFSQERDKIVIRFTKNKEDGFLEISVNPGFPYIIITNEFHRAKKNSIDFFGEYLPAEITGLEISKSDRIIRISSNHSCIYFMIRGKYTDVLLLEGESNAAFFKKYPGENIYPLLNEINSNEYTSEKNVPELRSISGEIPLESIREKYPIIGKEILREVNARNAAESTQLKKDMLRAVLKEIFENNPVVCFDKNTYEIFLSLKGFIKGSGAECREFENINNAISYYVNKKYYYDSVSRAKKRLTKHLEKEISKISHKLNDIKGLLDRGSREEYYSRIGNLLLINIKNIKTGMTEILIEDIFEDNQEIKIKLDGKLSPQKNTDRYFEKARGERKLIERSKTIFEDLKKKLSYLKDFELKVIEEENLPNLYKYMKELKMKGQVNPGRGEDLKEKFKHYIIENKYHVYVGKDSANNDMLTTKFAKQNDYWFHARSVPGSHVVLRAENPKEAVPKYILKKAAAIAAYHSKAKTSGTAPVSYTFKKYVIKKKGMEPGKVALLKEEVLLVKPEIPADCEYVTSG